MLDDEAVANASGSVSFLSVLRMIWVCRDRVVRVAICGYAGCGTRDAGLDGEGFGLTCERR